MPGDLITTGAALVGTGAWFADKIFGPGADAIGGQLKAYLQARLPAIFGLAEAKARELDVELQPIQPGLLARMIMDASFSNDSSEITEWWANLFVSASHAGTNKHAVFSDMMAVLGPKEAECLTAFMTSFDFARTEPWFKNSMATMRGSIDLMRDQAISGWVGETPIAHDRLQSVYLNLTGGQLPWPMRPISWSLPMKDQNDNYMPLRQTNPWYAENREAVEILERTRILKFSKVTLPVMGATAWVDTVEITSLGAEFYASCQGHLIDTQ